MRKPILLLHTLWSIAVVVAVQMWLLLSLSWTLPQRFTGRGDVFVNIKETLGASVLSGGGGDQTLYLTQSQYTDIGLTSPSADPIMPGAWQGSHWSANF